GPARNATTVRRLVQEVREVARTKGGEVARYAEVLGERLEDAPRLETANALHALLAKLQGASPEVTIDILASVEPATSDVAMREVLRNSDRMCRTVEATKWDLLGSAGELPERFAEEAVAVTEAVDA